MRRLVSTTKRPGPRGPAGTGVITLGLQSDMGRISESRMLVSLNSQAPSSIPGSVGEDARLSGNSWAGRAGLGEEEAPVLRPGSCLKPELNCLEGSRPGPGWVTGPVQAHTPSASFLPHLRGEGAAVPTPPPGQGIGGQLSPVPFSPFLQGTWAQPRRLQPDSPQAAVVWDARAGGGQHQRACRASGFGEQLPPPPTPTCQSC